MKERDPFVFSDDRSPKMKERDPFTPNTKHCDDCTQSDRPSKLIAIDTRYNQSINPREMPR